ncbi:MAG: exo-beta-N-acetylmuramidase NamZ family protein, partial [Planctomycetota bacterium]
MRVGKAAAILVLTMFSGGYGAVKTGLDNIASYHEMFRGKRVGIITNHTGCNSAGRHITDVFAEMEGVKVTALFGPEHGIKGSKAAGEKIDSEAGEAEDIPVYSLYGKTLKPTPEMLKNVDVLVFDIQDVGARFYTYTYTMSLAMEAAAENRKRFVVLDRPNPINGLTVEGSVLEPRFASFVGLYPIPVRHGMTVGELALMFNRQGWLKGGVRADLVVVSVGSWRRGDWYDKTGLRFIKPSPNMTDLNTAIVYPGLCLLEGTNVSEGRGTRKPFLQFGAPWIDAGELAARLNK